MVAKGLMLVYSRLVVAVSLAWILLGALLWLPTAGVRADLVGGGQLVPMLVLALAAAAVLVVERPWWRRRRWAHGAQVVQIVPPSEVDPKAGEVLWRMLGGIARSRWHRAIAGQPHVVFELVADAQGLRAYLWVPSPVPVVLAERAARAAWPAAHVSVRAPQPLASPAWRVVTGGRLICSGQGASPLATDASSGGDRLRGLASAMADTGRQTAIVQIIAQPASRKTALRVRRQVSTQAALSVPRDPIGRAVVRAAAQRAMQPLWQASICYLVASTEDHRSAGLMIRGSAAGIASALAAAFTGHTIVRRRRLLRPAVAIDRRWPRAPMLLSLPELAAVAHLPPTPTWTETGRRIPAPASALIDPPPTQIEAT